MVRAIIHKRSKLGTVVNLPRSDGPPILLLECIDSSRKSQKNPNLHVDLECIMGMRRKMDVLKA